MKLNIIKATTTDNLILSGILTEPDTKSTKIIIHVHGMSGDPYTNSYYPFMHNEYTSAGISFLAVEHRGTHSITQFINADGDIINIGDAYEIFEDCVLDIEAWVNKAIDLGYTEVWLQSHSLGPSKVAYYISQTLNENVKGLIFISPTDMHGANTAGGKESMESHEKRLAEAQKFVDEGKGESLLSGLVWGDTLISAKTYLNFFSKDSNAAIFNYGNSELGWKVVNSIKLPVLAITGTDDAGIAPVIDAYKAMEILEKELSSSPKVKTVVYENATHDFGGFEQKIVDEVLEFVK